jgi:hypothetical protein
MASGGKERRMVFDIRGRRRNVVKVVYAILAILMGTSLFLVVGPLNIGEIFSSSSGSGEAGKPFEEQAERIEVKLKRDPEDPELLSALARARVNAGNSQVNIEPNGVQQMTVPAFQQLQLASEAWAKYLKATDQPSASVAQLIAPVYISLAESSRTLNEAELNLQAAADAQRLVAEQRPSLNSLSTLAYYTYFTFDYPAAEKARKEAKELAGSASERESVDTQLDEVKKRAEEFEKRLKASEKQAESGGAAGGNPESLEKPSEGPLGESLRGGGLTE